MKNKLIYKILPWLVLFLFATNAGTVISLVKHMKAKTETAPGNIEAGDKMPDIQRTKYFTMELDLDPDQQDLVWDLNQQFNRQANRISRELSLLRFDMVSELGKADPDEQYLSSLSVSIGDRHAELKEATIKFYMGIKNICTPEQNEKLLGIFQGLLGEDEQGHARRGRGQGPGSMQRGRWGNPPGRFNSGE